MLPQVFQYPCLLLAQMLSSSWTCGCTVHAHGQGQLLYLYLRSISSFSYSQLPFQLFPLFFYCVNFPLYWIISISMHICCYFFHLKKKPLSALLHLSFTILFISFSLHQTVACIPSLQFFPSHSFVSHYHSTNITHVIFIMPSVLLNPRT